ncbi:MAG: zinc-ribbon domain-containing protein [Candidatus Krumholzibacteria bacterium]|nr:zinc-ribbon domain-containing protein [Candidatus Krumholzibacteria bacterium]
MIVTCGGCQTKYMLGDEKVPENGIRVRCPKCRFIWRLVSAVSEPVFEVSNNQFASSDPVAENVSGSWNSGSQPASVSAVVAEPSIDAMEQEIEITSAASKQAETSAEVSETPQQKKQRDRTRRLARVFVSDILVYNKNERDKALADGTLMTVMGPEIKKAWEAYKHKVGTEVRESNDYFREALNEILADGQELF